MKTVILQNNTRVATAGNTWTIEPIGPDGATKDALKEAIRKLEHHPAQAARRSLVDMLALIEESGLEVKFTEHYLDENSLDGWLFLLQGR